MRVPSTLAAALISACCVAFSAGCASSTQSHSSPPLTLNQLLQRRDPDVALIAGVSDLTTGSIRYTFLVITSNGASIERPRARVYVASGMDVEPFQRATATLEPVGVANEASAADVTHIYVTRLSIRKPGKYWILAAPLGKSAVQGLGNLVVRRKSFSPPVGSKAYPSNTPTLSSTHGDIRALTTRTPPDTNLLRYSIGGALRIRNPFVAVFATPKFCTSRACGPVVDVVSAVRKRFLHTNIRFIHVEIYRDNDPTKGFNRWVRQWHLPTEPWVFLVGRDGRIKAKFEGSVSESELANAVRTTLLKYRSRTS